MKSTIGILLGILLSWQHLCAADTSFVKVHVKMYEKDSFSVHLERPYSEIYYNQDSSIQNSKTVFFNDEASVAGVAMNGCNLYTIVIQNNKGEIVFKLPLAMEPGDSLFVFFTAEKIPGWGNKIIVSGNNANAHNYVIQNTHALSAEVYGASDSSFQSFYMAADHYIDSLLVPWKALLQNNQVTQPVYDLYTADIKSKLYSEVLAELSHILHKDKKPSAEKVGLFLNFKDLVFYKGKGQNPLLLKTFHGSGLYDKYLRYIIDLDPLTDTLLQKTDKAYFFLYDSSYRSFAWGESLYSKYKMFKHMPDLKEKQNSDDDFKIYKALEPQSPFIPLIERFVIEQSSAKETKEQ